MNREEFDRLKFVLKTKYKVALMNYSIEQTFHPAIIIELLRNRRFVAGLASLIVLAFITATFSNSHIIVGESVATVQEVTVVKPKPAIPMAVKVIQKAVIEKPPTVEETIVAKKVIASTYKMDIPIKREKELSKLVVAIPHPEKGAKYTVAVDKLSRTLYILLENRQNYRIVQTFRVSLGLVIGDKLKTGDKKTPEGFYKVIQIKEDNELPNIYGPRAYVLNYPNKYDRADGNTGGGIWIHGTGEGMRTPDTKGCVEVTDENIIALGKWVDVETPVLIFPASKPMPIKNGTVEKNIINRQFFYPQTITTSKI